MPTIEIDFDVFKELTHRRIDESMTENEVIRELLELPKAQHSPQSSKPTSANAWIAKGVIFPEGTQFRATHKGQVYTGQVKNRNRDK